MPKEPDLDRLIRLREAQIATRKPKALKRSQVITSKVRPRELFLVE